MEKKHFKIRRVVRYDYDLLSLILSKSINHVVYSTNRLTISHIIGVSILILHYNLHRQKYIILSVLSFFLHSRIIV